MSKLIIGSRRTRITGETIVPGAPHEPDKACSPTPSTRPNEPKLIYKQQWHQKKPAKESFPTPPLALRTSPNSSNTTSTTMPAAAAARPQVAKQTTNFQTDTMPNLPPFALGECGGKSAEGLGCFASHLTHATTAKKNISAAPQAAKPPCIVTSPRAARTTETIERSSSISTNMSDSASSRAFLAKNTVVKTLAAVTAASQAAEPPSTATPPRIGVWCSFLRKSV